MNQADLDITTLNEVMAEIDAQNNAFPCTLNSTENCEMWKDEAKNVLREATTSLEDAQRFYEEN